MINLDLPSEVMDLDLAEEQMFVDTVAVKRRRHTLRS